MRTLIEAARLFNEAGKPYQALEVCSRYPKIYELRQDKGKILPLLRETYQDDFPATHQVGKLLDEAFLVVDLVSGAVLPTPHALYPARGCCLRQFTSRSVSNTRSPLLKKSPV